MFNLLRRFDLGPLESVAAFRHLALIGKPVSLPGAVLPTAPFSFEAAFGSAISSTPCVLRTPERECDRGLSTLGGDTWPGLLRPFARDDILVLEPSSLAWRIEPCQQPMVFNKCQQPRRTLCTRRPAPRNGRRAACHMDGLARPRGHGPLFVTAFHPLANTAEPVPARSPLIQPLCLNGFCLGPDRGLRLDRPTPALEPVTHRQRGKMGPSHRRRATPWQRGARTKPNFMMMKEGLSGIDPAACLTGTGTTEPLQPTELSGLGSGSRPSVHLPSPI